MDRFFKKIKLAPLVNERATYTFLELKEYLDWEVKRVYFIQNCQEATGQHCHKQEKEMFLMVKGTCTAVIDWQNGKEEVSLSGPGEAILVGNYVWHGFKDFSPDAIVLALSSTNYLPDRSDYVEDYPSSGRTYLPTASYFEMMEWSLPSDQQIKLKKIKEEMKQSGKYDEYNKFLRGGFFRNFFVKYPESNNMHKKMLLVSKKLGAVRDSNPSSDRKKLIKEAEKNLYKGQCNCAYWHGIFGGLYLSNLRNAIYEHLIRAENILQRLQRGDKKYTELLITDFDKEGNEEILLSNPYLNMYFSPQEGGALFEMDYKPKEFNCMNVLTRRKEAYHESILNGETGNAPPKETHSIHDAIHLKEEGIEKYLVYDSLRRASFVDHFLSADADLNELKFAKVLDLGDFAGKPYAFFPVRKNDEVQLNLSRIGKVNGQEVKLTKTISLMSGQSIVSVDYEIVNNGEENIKCIFGIEFNLTLLGGNSPDRYYKINWEKLENSYLASEGVLDEVKSVQLVDEWKGFSVSFELNYECNFVRYPIETVSQSEGGLEKTYQGSCLFFSWEINIAPKEVWTNRLILKIES